MDCKNCESYYCSDSSRMYPCIGFQKKEGDKKSQQKKTLKTKSKDSLKIKEHGL